MICTVALLPQDGVTPLSKAAREGRLEVVEELLRAGADVDATDKVRPFPCWGPCGKVFGCMCA
jgi:ankyrin repeat protein